MFDQHCASCHASEKTGRRMPLAAVDTDRERMDTWNKDNADRREQGGELDGDRAQGTGRDAARAATTRRSSTASGLRAPYLHNGSVPTLRDLLEPAANRPKVFWRGYDLYDQANLGFVTQGDEAKRIGTRFDTSERANGNGGHVFGVDLPKGEKDALLEYLKTL